MSIRWEGIEALNRTLQRAEDDATQNMGSALRIEAERIMTDSKRNYVPVDQGTLRASGTVIGPDRQGRVALGYGGAASAYALVQHERLDYAHRVGRAKYLEIPVNNAVAGLARRTGEHLDVFD